jgi:hypothetical protein
MAVLFGRKCTVDVTSAVWADRPIRTRLGLLRSRVETPKWRRPRCRIHPFSRRPPAVMRFHSLPFPSRDPASRSGSPLQFLAGPSSAPSKFRLPRSRAPRTPAAGRLAGFPLRSLAVGRASVRKPGVSSVRGACFLAENRNGRTVPRNCSTGTQSGRESRKSSVNDLNPAPCPASGALERLGFSKC